MGVASNSTLFYQTATASGGASSTAAYTVSSTGNGTLIIAADRLGVVGTTIKISGRGTHLKGAGNLTLAVNLNGTAIWTTGSVNSGAAGTTENFEFAVEGTIRTTGATGTILALGRVSYIENNASFPLGSGTAQTIDTTVTQTITVTHQWAASNASNNTTLDTLVVQIL